jgi:Family of unknown function (DUF6266)
MARVSNPLIGASSGSIGGVTLTSWKGINVAKSKPTTVANPQTDKQLERRNAISQIVAIFRLIAASVNAGFKSLAIQKSAYNAFSSWNLKNAFTYDGTSPAVLNHADLLISKGSIATTPILTVVSADSDETVGVTFAATASGAGQSLTDLAILVVYNEDTEEWYGELTSAARSTGAAEIEMPTACSTGDTLHVYLGFTSVSGLYQSDSQYMTDDVPA